MKARRVVLFNVCGTLWGQHASDLDPEIGDREILRRSSFDPSFKMSRTRPIVLEHMALLRPPPTVQELLDYALYLVLLKQLVKAGPYRVLREHLLRLQAESLLYRVILLGQ